MYVLSCSFTTSQIRRKLVSVCLAMLAAGWIYAVPPAGMTEIEITRLRRQIAPLIASNDDVALRHGSADVYRMIDALVAKGRNDEAERYLARILKADASAFEYQLTYGELLAAKGKPEELKQRAALTLQFAEEDSTLRRAARLAQAPAPEAPALLDKSAVPVREVVLIPTGGVSEVTLGELRDRLRDLPTATEYHTANAVLISESEPYGASAICGGIADAPFCRNG